LAADFLAGAFVTASVAGAAGSATAAPPVGGAGKAPFNFLTTGGSTVDDADLTNSPSSWSLVMTTLLSTPSSLASS
jgi:hypothetical protein